MRLLSEIAEKDREIQRLNDQYELLEDRLKHVIAPVLQEEGIDSKNKRPLELLKLAEDKKIKD